jgi:hypothetical protein
VQLWLLKSIAVYPQSPVLALDTQRQGTAATSAPDPKPSQAGSWLKGRRKKQMTKVTHIFRSPQKKVAAYFVLFIYLCFVCFVLSRFWACY